MKTLHHLLSEKIFAVTANIQQNFPGLYEHLDETPFSLEAYETHEIEDTDLIHYLEELISQMNAYKETTPAHKRITIASLVKLLNSTSESLNENWEDQKEQLLEKFAALKETDLLFIDGKKEEMFERIRKIMRVSKEELALLLYKF